jgi:hypothetical protein
MELNIARYKADISTIYFLYDRVTQYKVEAFSIRINSYVRTAFTAGKIQPYIKGGIGFSYLSKADVERSYTEPSFKPTILNPLNMPKSSFQYFMAFGLKYNNYFIEPRFENSIDNIIHGSDYAITKQLSFVCGYAWNFNKNVAKE